MDAWSYVYIAHNDTYPKRVMARRKLTLSVDEAAIDTARRYSKRHGTSVSELVTRYLGSLEDTRRKTTPIVSKLRGILPSDATIEDYRRHIADKHAE